MTLMRLGLMLWLLWIVLACSPFLEASRLVHELRQVPSVFCNWK